MFKWIMGHKTALLTVIATCLFKTSDGTTFKTADGSVFTTER